MCFSRLLNFVFEFDVYLITVCHYLLTVLKENDFWFLYAQGPLSTHVIKI